MFTKTSTDARPEHDLTRHEHYRPGELDMMTVLTNAVHQLHSTVRGDRGILLSGATPRVLYNGVSGKLTSSAARWIGFHARETSGAGTALVRFRDGDLGGDLVGLVSLAANESAREWFGPGGIAVGQGLYAEVVSGQVELVAYLGGR
jgi:hypothetical protein